MCTACGFDFYQNPSPAAVVAIPHPRDERSLLMLRRRTPPNEGRWCVPGGFIRYGEDPVAAAAREALEEVGLEIRIERPIRAGLVDYRYRGRQICVVEVSFVGRIVGDLPEGPIVSAEASEVVFQPVDRVLADPSMLAFPEQLEVVLGYRWLLDQAPLRATPA